MARTPSTDQDKSPNAILTVSLAAAHDNWRLSLGAGVRDNELSAIEMTGQRLLLQTHFDRDHY
jgi:hypothetical protein